MKKAMREKLQANLNKALEPPRTSKRDASDALVSRYAAPPEIVEPAEKLPSPPRTISSQTILRQTIPQENTISDSPLIDPNNGYYPTFNDISDRLIPTLKLDAYEQTVLLRMYRLSRGWRRQTCTLGYGAIVKACNISRSQAQRAVASLVAKKLIVNLGKAKGIEGTEYRVLPDVPAIPQQAIVCETIASETQTVPQENIVEASTIFPQNTNKHTAKNNTHNTTGARVRSRFSLSECRRYAESLRKDGITNPGGYATKIHRSGEADDLIAVFLNPPPVPASADISQCPDCEGTGWYYPQGREMGAARCKHERLRIEA